MLLTTEPSISGKAYTVLRVVFGVGYEYSGSPDLLERAVGEALAALERKAHQLEADAVIGVHLSTSGVGPETSLNGGFCVVVMGTAIKFQGS